MSDISTGSVKMPAMGERRFGRVNWLGLWTLIQREVQRFLNVWTQTVMAPVATGALVHDGVHDSLRGSGAR